MQDELFDKVVRHIISKGGIVVVDLQCEFKIGYNRLRRIIQKMVVKGIVSDVAHGSTSRKVLMTLEEYENNSKKQE